MLVCAEGFSSFARPQSGSASGSSVGGGFRGEIVFLLLIFVFSFLGPYLGGLLEGWGVVFVFFFLPFDDFFLAAILTDSFCLA